MNNETIVCILSIVFGWLSFILSTSSCIFQLVLTFKKKNASSLSLISFLVFFISSSCWFAWSIGNYFQMMYFMLNVKFALLFFPCLAPMLMNGINLIITFILLLFKILNIKKIKKQKENGAKIC